jgi:hypothetical protein
MEGVISESVGVSRCAIKKLDVALDPTSVENGPLDENQNLEFT